MFPLLPSQTTLNVGGKKIQSRLRPLVNNLYDTELMSRKNITTGNIRWTTYLLLFNKRLQGQWLNRYPLHFHTILLARNLDWAWFSKAVQEGSWDYSYVSSWITSWPRPGWIRGVIFLFFVFSTSSRYLISFPGNLRVEGETEMRECFPDLCYIILPKAIMTKTSPKVKPRVKNWIEMEKMWMSLTSYHTSEWISHQQNSSSSHTGTFQRIQNHFPNRKCFWLSQGLWNSLFNCHPPSPLHKNFMMNSQRPHPGLWM